MRVFDKECVHNVWFDDGKLIPGKRKHIEEKDMKMRVTIIN